MGLIYMRKGRYCYNETAAFTRRVLTSQVLRMGLFPGQDHHLQDLGGDPKRSSRGNINLIIL